MAEVEQWSIHHKIGALDRGGMQVKNKREIGDTFVIQIEPHATVNMLKQRSAMLVTSHPKFIRLANEAGTTFDDETMKLKDCEGVTNNCTIMIYVEQPKVEVKPVEPLSDDEELWGAEEEEVEPLPEGEALTKELTDEEIDKQNALKGVTADLLDDGDKAGALKKFTEAVMVGAPTAMMLSKRAEMLLKMKRAKAAEKDATAALAINPDSGKAYRVRGKARRFLGDYAGAKADLDAAQKIDYDDSIEDLHKYLTKRVAKIAALAAAEAAAEAAKEPETA
mmetsp:Transcript_7363/g.16674  ORF Transcript_7363/g.16674 Transcript_7363/m.16674 type:complete len:279 (+) Transcript_7363:141-977(+)|eukprot:CAMPEP_0206459274 /NCGR_PEP_ID=MMETSP0324_2-20121206/24083_1 /ASSEMBLY_ACC=CAM_ASM_000836 /TAXON_ID=2866 /ORGANISM="Crypthecodinium cohnii, Strain Seligo" /LENGTH=278 /DNA_ID=CAMNT_0053930803 /DNA_START=131 /DNA_END=967 /DNA_ORIENTATION=-